MLLWPMRCANDFASIPRAGSARFHAATGIGLVIPGTGSFRGTVSLTADWPASGANGVDRGAWLDGAELLHIEWHSVGSYPVSTEVAASPPSLR